MPPKEKKQKEQTSSSKPTAADTAAPKSATAFEKRVEEKQQKMNELEANSLTNRILSAVVVLLQAVAVALVILLLCAVASAACFTHRHPLSVYIVEREAAASLGGDGSNMNNNNNNNLLTWQYLGAPPADFAHDSYSASEASSSLLVNTRFCRDFAGPHVMPLFVSWISDFGANPGERHATTLYDFTSSGSGDSKQQQQQQQTSAASSLYIHKDWLSSFVRGVFRTSRRLDYFFTTTLVYKSPFFNEANTFGVVSAAAEADKKQQPKKSSSIKPAPVFLCEFARASGGGGSNKQRTAGGSVRIASLFDFLAASELREILVARSGTLFSNNNTSNKDDLPLEYQAFLDKSGGAGTFSDDATATFNYLRYLYAFSSSSDSDSDPVVGDTTFLGDFLAGFISVPHDNGVARIQFAVPQSRVGDGFIDCCDGSDEASAAAPTSSDDDDDKKKKKKKRAALRKTCGFNMRTALFTAQQKLFRLARGIAHCSSRARSGVQRMEALAADTASKLQALEPQWAQVQDAFSKRIAVLTKLQAAATAPGAKPQTQQKFQKALMEFQGFQQQVQQFHQYKLSLDQMQTALTGPLGDSGQFLNVFERHVQVDAAAAAEQEMNDAAEGGEEQQQQKQKQKSKVEVTPFCSHITLDPKRLQGGSAEPVFTTARLRVCPFRAADSASEEALQKFEQQQQQQGGGAEEPERTLLGRYFGNLGFWPAFAVAGRRTFMDVLPQMPSRIARARIRAAKAEYIALVQAAGQAFKNNKKKQSNSKDDEEPFDGSVLLSAADNRLVRQATAYDAEALLVNLENRSLHALLEKHDQEKNEFVQKKRTEALEAAAAVQQQQQAAAVENPEAKEPIEQQQPEFDAAAAAAEFPAFNPATVDTVEHRWSSGNWSRFLRGSSVLVGQPHIYRFGQSCWKGPVERMLAMFFVCGDRDRIVDFREDGKCVYEVVYETPSACCTLRRTQSAVTETVAQDFFGPRPLRMALFHTQIQQPDNTLVRRYSAVEGLLTTWMKFL